NGSPWYNPAIRTCRAVRLVTSLTTSSASTVDPNACRMVQRCRLSAAHAAWYPLMLVSSRPSASKTESTVDDADDIWLPISRRWPSADARTPQTSQYTSRPPTTSPLQSTARNTNAVASRLSRNQSSCRSPGGASRALTEIAAGGCVGAGPGGGRGAECRGYTATVTA